MHGEGLHRDQRDRTWHRQCFRPPIYVTTSRHLSNYRDLQTRNRPNAITGRMVASLLVRADPLRPPRMDHPPVAYQIFLLLPQFLFPLYPPFNLHLAATWDRRLQHAKADPPITLKPHSCHRFRKRCQMHTALTHPVMLFQGSVGATVRPNTTWDLGLMRRKKPVQ